MNKKDLAKHISLNSGLDMIKSKQVICVLKDIIKGEIRSGGNISIRRFGKFCIKNTKKHKYYNISQKKVCTAPAKRTFIFIPSSHLLEGNLSDVVIMAPLLLPNIRIGKTRQYPNVNTNNMMVKGNDNSKQIHFSSFGGNILLPNALNIGQRQILTSHKEPFKIRHIGKVENELNVPFIIEHTQYPYILSPKNGTSIIGYNSFSGITGGVTEPILYYALFSLKDIEPQIEIIQNISIPIQNRNYGYKPDIAIIWKEKNIYIDIEIDEPYDIISRKPIHFLNCSDKLRNAYLINNGWFVFRFAEEQIAKNLDNVCHIIYKYIAFITRKKKFIASSDDAIIARWTYDEAMKMASENYREKYLGIIPHKNDSKLCIPNYIDDCLVPDNFSFVKPDFDIIENRYKTLENNIKAELLKHKYIIIKRSSDCYDFVTEKNFVEFIFDEELCSYGIRLIDTVEQKCYFVPYYDLESYRTTDAIITEIKHDNWPSAIEDCIVNCHPIHINYTNNEGQTAERDVFFLTPWYKEAYSNLENREKYTDIELLSLYSNYIYLDSVGFKQRRIFSGYCSYRHELRTFNVGRINYGVIYNCYKPKCLFGNEHIWMQLDERGDGIFAEHIYHNLSCACQNRLVEKGNFVNALIMQSKLKEAMKICLSIKKDTFIPEIRKTWIEMVSEDIDYFISKDNHKEEFEEMKLLLKEKEWR